jgi:NADPH oxidase
MKDNLNDARATYTWTYMVARAAALTLHFDISLILFRELLISE